MVKKIVFLTATRADFGKMMALIEPLEKDNNFQVHVFVTGMHMLPKYGNTCNEVKKCGFKNIYYYVNQRNGDYPDAILANTINGLSNYLKLVKPDLLVVHGDRVEALAGAISGALNNFIVAHIEGGEVSGTIDESIRHSVSKLAHLHFVSNKEAKNRLIRMGEDIKRIFVIGSPDIDMMLSDDLPKLSEVKKHYGINFDGEYAIFIYHPVTTSLHNLIDNFRNVLSALIDSQKNYIMIYPNNDPGGDLIIEELELYRNQERLKLFPSVRFEYFLTLLKNSEFIIGNSSAGIREAPLYGVPCINIGSRQKNRFSFPGIINVDESKEKMLKAIKNVKRLNKSSSDHFGDGKSAKRFAQTLKNKNIWGISPQKYFMEKD